MSGAPHITVSLLWACLEGSIKLIGDVFVAVIPNLLLLFKHQMILKLVKFYLVLKVLLSLLHAIFLVQKRLNLEIIRSDI